MIKDFVGNIDVSGYNEIHHAITNHGHLDAEQQLAAIPTCSVSSLISCSVTQCHCVSTHLTSSDPFLITQPAKNDSDLSNC